MREYLFILLILQSLHTAGQIQPVDSAETVRKVALYSDYVREGNFKEAKEPMEWLLKNRPDYHVSIYINAEKVYKALLKEEKDPANVLLLQRSMLAALDARITYFGNRKAVLKRKAFWAYNYWKSDASKYSQLLAMIDTTIALNNGVIPGNLYIAKMDVTRRMKVSGEVSNWDILETYEGIIAGLDQLPDTKGNKKARSVVDELLIKTVKLDCEELGEWFAPKLEKSPTDTTLAKQVIRFGLTLKCTEAAYFIQSVEVMYAANPNPGMAKLLAAKYYQQQQYKKAEKIYLDILSMSNSAEDKYNSYMLLATNSQKAKDRIASRNYAKKALEVGINFLEPYELIGDLYYTSQEACLQRKSRVQDRSVYWVAYDYYEKAKNQSKMKLAKAQFPAMVDIFNEGYKEGEEYAVECWVNEKTTIRKRPAESEL
jgi:tetratricopeptide (TPR) repeat protein